MRKTNTNKFIMFLIMIVVSLTFLSGCTTRRTLLFLNWGEYINDDLVELFEEEFNCNLIVDIADSNELFYAKIKSGTTAYDLVCPAEYMVEKMYINDLIQEIDYTKLSALSGNTNEERYQNYRDSIMPGVIQIEDYLNDDMKKLSENLNFEYDYSRSEINHYHMPYFWGTFGLMYNKDNDFFADNATYNSNGIKVSDVPDGDPDKLQEDNNAWKIYFFDEDLPEESKLPLDTKVGAYDSVRFFYGAVMTYDKSDPNVSVTENIESFREIISRRKYKEWGGDSLKHSIAAHNLDMAFAYTGDCLDMVYLSILDGNEFEDVDFYTYTPSTTMAHVDTLVIPKNARHVDLAHEFMNFLLTKEYSWYNNRDIGYCPVLKSVYDMIMNLEGPDEEAYPSCYVELDEEELHWRTNWAKAIKQTFPVVDFENGDYTSVKTGIPFSYFENSDIKLLTNAVNNVKVKSS